MLTDARMAMASVSMTTQKTNTICVYVGPTKQWTELVKMSKQCATGKQLEVTGFKQCKFMLHTGLKLTASKSLGKQFYNIEDFTLTVFNVKFTRLTSEDGHKR